MLRGELQRAAIARREQRVLVALAAAPNRSDGVDDMARLQIEAGRDLGVAGRTAAELAASFEQARTGGAMNGPVDAAAAGKPLIGGVDDRVDVERRDVGDENFETRGRGFQALAGCFTSMPASARWATSSPDWNISRTMSQPPMNSPLM